MKYILGFCLLTLLGCSVLVKHLDDFKKIAHEIVDCEIDEIDDIFDEDKDND